MTDPGPAAVGPSDPFELLGLPASADVTDDDVRSAWRRIAAATHPERTDGGNPARFAAASAAYTILRTRSGRGETLADLAELRQARPHRPPPREAPAGRDLTPAAAAHSAPAAATHLGARGALVRRHHPPLPARLLARTVARVARGRPAVLAVRLAIVVAIGVGTAALVGSAPATPALISGALTWLVLTARHDLAPPE